MKATASTSGVVTPAIRRRRALTFETVPVEPFGGKFMTQFCAEKWRF
jgi:hypothetical protein